MNSTMVDSNQAHWFNRNITNIQNFADDKVSRNFMDKNGQEMDDNAVSMLEDLRQNKLPHVLPTSTGGGADMVNITDYDVAWLPERGVDPEASQEHKDYLEKFCDNFEDLMRMKIEKAILSRFDFFLYDTQRIM